MTRLGYAGFYLIATWIFMLMPQDGLLIAFAGYLTFTWWLTLQRARDAGLKSIWHGAWGWVPFAPLWFMFVPTGYYNKPKPWQVAQAEYPERPGRTGTYMYDVDHGQGLAPYTRKPDE